MFYFKNGRQKNNSVFLGKSVGVLGLIWYLAWHKWMWINKVLDIWLTLGHIRKVTLKSCPMQIAGERIMQHTVAINQRGSILVNITAAVRAFKIMCSINNSIIHLMIFLIFSLLMLKHSFQTKLLKLLIYLSWNVTLPLEDMSRVSRGALNCFFVFFFLGGGGRDVRRRAQKWESKELIFYESKV